MKYFFYGVGFDFLFVLNIAGFLLIPFLLLFFLHRHLGIGFYTVTSAIIVIITSILSFSFIFLNSPVTWSIYSMDTFKLSGIFRETGLLSFVMMIILLMICGAMIWLLFRFHLKRYLYILFFSISFLSIFFYDAMFPKGKYFYVEHNMNITINKLNYLIHNWKETRNKEYIDDYTYSNIRLETSGDHFSESSFESVSSVYPFMRKITKTDDIGQFFENQTTPPNFIFIICENMGRSASGNNAYLGSYTPQLDKLARQSVYFNYFLSTSAKAFNSIPSIFASVPYGNEGFMALQPDIPHHFSLLNILAENNYQTAYFSGANSYFKYTQNFFKANKVHTINMPELNGQKQELSNLVNNSGITILDDNTVFNNYLNWIKTQSTAPFSHIIYLSSINSPELFPDIDSYQEAFLNSSVKSNIDFNKDKFKSTFAAIMAEDDAIGRFISNFNKLEQSKNTIIIITGTNGLSKIPNRNRISKYHVPLLIYSPLIKQAVEINALSSHLDITPSLINYLQKYYHLKIPEMVNWMGSGLSLSPEMSNVHSFALMRNKNILSDYIHGMYLLSDAQVFKIEKYFNLSHMPNEENLEFLHGKLQTFIQYNNYIQKENNIISDSVYTAFFK